ncbi:MAG: flippase-like domain-containing protein, partial [Bdellovibrionales bacterium]|nr:flippase-like domain-containing protein [Bdellovibrionales bacterium]
LERLGKRFEYRFTEFALTRIQVFIDGLSPLFAWKRLLPVALWSIAIWSIELAAYVAIGESFQVEMPLRYYILFLVTLNFSSLVPAAPGGIGVIEAITSGVLVKVGVDREIALAMVISQHLIQYIVVGIPGSISMFTWKQEIQRVAAQKQ